MTVLRFVLTERGSKGDNIQSIHDEIAKTIVKKGSLCNWSIANAIDEDRRGRIVYTPCRVYSVTIKAEKDVGEVKKAVKDISKRIGMEKPIIFEG